MPKADKLNDRVLIVLIGKKHRTGVAVPNSVSQDRITTAAGVFISYRKYTDEDTLHFMS